MYLTSRTIKIIYDKNIIIFDRVVASFDVFLHSIICPHYIYIYIADIKFDQALCAVFVLYAQAQIMQE